MKYLHIDVSRERMRSHAPIFSLFLCPEDKTWGTKPLKIGPGIVAKMSIVRNQERHLVLPQLPCPEWGFLQFVFNATHMFITVSQDLKARTVLFDELANECWIGHTYKLEPIKIPLIPRISARIPQKSV